MASNILSKGAVILPSSEVLGEYRAKYPVYFEITDRIAATGVNAFKSSEVTSALLEYVKSLLIEIIGWSRSVVLG